MNGQERRFLVPEVPKSVEEIKNTGEQAFLYTEENNQKYFFYFPAEYTREQMQSALAELLVL